MTVLSIIKQLRATNSKNDKEAILRANINNQDLKTFFRLALHPFVTFYQKKPISVDVFTGAKDLSWCMDWLEEMIAGRKITGNAAISCIQDVMKQSDRDTMECLQMILQKNPDCGVDTTVEKVWPGTNPEFPCALATAFTEDLFKKHFTKEKKFISQLKSDGARVQMIIKDNTVSLFTRSGRELNLHGVFDLVGHQVTGDWVIDGELLCVDPNTGKFMNRQSGNGIVSKAVKNTIPASEAKFLHLVAWDMIPLADFRNGEGKETYLTRFDRLTAVCALGTIPSVISIIPTRIVSSLEQANRHYQEMVTAGEEGTMLKRFGDIWRDKREKWVLKLKGENTGDLRVIGAEEGRGKLAGNLGALLVETDDHKVKVSISGFSLKLRSEICANIAGKPIEYQMMVDDEWKTFTAMPGDSDIKLDSIVEVMYNQKIKLRDSETWSLFLPRFKTYRSDKKTTDTLETLV